MDWLEQNLDAYRILSEILDDLRQTLRAELEILYGKKWYKSGLPDGLLERLVDSKEREKAIDWYESEYQQVISYAVFPDLLAILEHNSSSFPEVMRLAPTGALLHARFLELEVMRAKIGRARPISDTELSFLGTFHLRFKRAVNDFRDRQSNDGAAGDGSAEVGRPATEAPDPTPHIVVPSPDEEEQEPPPESVEVGTPSAAPGRGPEGDEPPSKPSRAADSGEARGPQRVATTAAEDTTVDEDKPTPFPSGKDDDQAKDTSDEDRSSAPSIDRALEDNDHTGVLRELYREVTSTAEDIWTKDVPPSPRIWQKVRLSDWYETNFSGLGLMPLSDFYEVMSQVEEMMRSGTSKEDLQDFLKQANFAQILLSLRDLFQKHQV